MAHGNARREAYTAGGKAPLLNPEILIDDAFTLVIMWGQHRKRRERRGAKGRPGSENGGIATGKLARKPGRSCLVRGSGKAGKGMPAENNSPRPVVRICPDDGSAQAKAQTPAGRHGTGWRNQ